MVLFIGVLNRSFDKMYPAAVEEAQIMLLSRQQAVVIKAYIVMEPCKQFKSLLQQLLILQSSIASSRSPFIATM